MAPDLTENSRTDHWSLNNKSFLQRILEHRYAPIILTICMLLILFLTTAFIAYQVKKPNEAANTEVSIEDETSPGSTLQKVEALDTADWKTYSNQVYGFSFNHPPNWKIEDTYYESGDGDSSIGYDGVILIPPDNILGNGGISFYVLRNNGKNLQEYFSEKDYRCCGINIPPTGLQDKIANGEKVVVGELNGTKIESPEHFPFNTVHGEWIVIEKDKHIYLFSKRTDSTVKDFDIDMIYNQILSTIDFIDSKNLLVEITYDGGLCIEGTCQTNYSIMKDGTILMDDVEVATLDRSQLEKLQQLILHTNFTEIKSNPFTDTCPVAYDGQEATYTFYLENTEEVIPSCTYEINETDPLFSEINQIIENLN